MSLCTLISMHDLNLQITDYLSYVFGQIDLSKEYKP